MNRKNLFISAALAALGFVPFQKSHATNLSLGADYYVRGVSIDERDKNFKKNDYYDQRLEAYLTTDLSKDVEATVRIQSITPWGLESSTTPLTTRYPNANGSPWVQNAFVRLPNIWNNRIILTLGRQPIQWGDGEILSDDDLGFNALRGQLKSPFRWLPIDLDAFTAKITEGLRAPGDTNLTGVMLGFSHNYTRWEIVDLIEKTDVQQNYQLGADTSPVAASKIDRSIMGIRMKTTLKDAYIKGAYYLQSGTIRREDLNPANKNVKLGGHAYMIGLGGKSNTQKMGRFGALLELSVGDGDDLNTPEKEEAFRPTFASRWSGLERKGYGRYFASTFSDAYSPTNSFGNASTTNTGLPAGTSGIQSIRFGVDSTPWAQWTFTFDFFQYKAMKNISGPRDLGTEFDYGVVYRYSGLVSFKATYNQFKPGEAFDTPGALVSTKKEAKSSTAEVEIKF